MKTKIIKSVIFGVSMLTGFIVTEQIKNNRNNDEEREEESATNTSPIMEDERRD